MPPSRGNSAVMLNMMTHAPTTAEIAALLRETRPAPLLPPLGSPRWTEVAGRTPLQPWIAALHAQAREELGRPLPALSDELYAHFRADGNRTLFEHPYFECRMRLGRAALCALLMPGEAQWLAETVRVMRAVMDETSWALPAHVVSPTGKDPGCIDLFGAETAEDFGALAALFGDKLPADLAAAIKARVRTQITDNFLTAYARGEHPGAHWVHGAGNWNAVCHQGVTGAVLYLEEDPDVVAQVLHQTAGDLGAFLASFTPDGGCSEGAGYWNYGFGRFAWLNEQIETYTQGALSLMVGSPQMREVAAFARRLSIEGGRVINFADCDAFGMPDAALSAYLGERLDDPASRQQAQVSYAAGLSGPGGKRLFDLLRFALYCPAQVAADARPHTEDWYYPDLQVMIAGGRNANGRQTVFAAKGGHNAELHNHNDCGSFVLYVGGAAMATEIGAPEYTRQLFGPERYTFLATGSFGHSVPVINGSVQGSGGRYAARVLTHSLSPAQAMLTLDLSDAYPAEADCAAYRRTLVFDKQTLALDVEDVFALREARQLETALITDAEAAIQSDGTALLIKDGRQARLRPGPNTRIDTVQTHGYSSHGGHPQSIRRIALVPVTLALDTSLRYTLQPEQAGLLPWP